jgi:putative glutamine amidotransferase
MPGPPRIGITCAHEHVTYGGWTEDAALVPLTYVRRVAAAGGLPLLLPALDHAVDDMLAGLDGVLLTGGAGDVDPAHYGAEPHPETVPVDAARDGFELALARAAVARDLPLLGVCRGMQVLNVAYGGDLVQHLDFGGGHRGEPGEWGGHDVVLVAGSLASRACGGARVGVTSWHHQALATVGNGLEVTGRALADDLVEAVEDPRRRFVLGVQWHPEEDEADRVIAAFVAAARLSCNRPGNAK